MTHAAEPSPTQRAAFRNAAEHRPGIGRDWRDPIIGLGAHDARLCIFGRNRGRTEVERALPFVGKGGQLEAEVFWLNTVPYKHGRWR
ncbi:hypothetical protein [Variovorax ginsengisoli]|uniref:Uracil-DNA glycosylase n=1 Tax=Variovorax ginsengisoli TaxID=363844 RepID=A0ABT9S4E0_9BURK|nr:hypothetical protein [Variovorax ginsengisoli]MDP9899211.1 uracil-DNA glycosylase [Variovorax ginsengisoli]